MNNFSEQIKSLRNGLSFKSFERKTGIPAATLQYLEKPTSDIKGGQIIKLCKSLGVSADWLLGLDGHVKGHRVTSGSHSAVAINGNANNCANCGLMRAAAKMMEKKS